MTETAKSCEPAEPETFTGSVKGNSLMFLIVTATFILLAYSSALYLITSESALEDQSTGNAVAGLVSTLGAAFPLADSALQMGFNEIDVLNSLSPASKNGDAAEELLPFIINSGEIRVRDSAQVKQEVIDSIINNLQNAAIGDVTLPNSSEPVRVCRFNSGDKVWIAAAAHLPFNRGMLGYAREISPYLLSGERVQRQLVGFLVMAYVIFITLLVLVLRIITHPLKKLTFAAERFAKGDFRPIDDVPRSIAELGVLASAFNRMGSELENHQESLLEYSRKLEEANQITGSTMKELEKSNRELKAMTESAFRAIELEMPQQVIELTVKRLRDDLDLAGAALFMPSEKGDPVPRRLPGLPLSSGNTIPVETANILRDCLNRTDTKSPNGNLVRKLKDKTGEKLYVPMAVGYNTIGVLELAAKKGKSFDSGSECFLNHFIPHMEIILRNKALYQETIRRSHELARVNMISRTISGELDQDKLLRDVVEYTEKTIRAESAFIGILDSGRLYIKYVTPGTANIENWEIDPSSDPLIEKIINSNQPELTPDLDSIPGLPPDGIVNLNDFRSFVGCPITHQGQVEGVLCGFSRIPNAFSSDDLYFLELLASQVAIAIANAKLFKEVISRDIRRDEQLRVAQKLQKDRIPQSFKHNVASLNCVLKPADELAGDFCDVFALGRNSVAVVIGDVANKGIAASLMTFSLLSMFRNVAKTHKSPCDILESINRSLIAQIKEDYWFATAFYGRLNTKLGTFTYSSAGQETPLWFHSDSKEVEMLDAEGYPLGLFGSFHYETKEITLKQGDRIVLYTDGITDAANITGERFGHERLIDILKNFAALTSRELTDKIVTEVEKFADGAKQRDDIIVSILELEEDPWVHKKIVYGNSGNLINEILDSLNAYNLDSQTAFSIRLSLDEALANAWLHGVNLANDIEFEVSYLITEEEFQFRVKDPGKGFDHESLPDPTVEENLYKSHGRGVFLMRQLMDDVDFNDIGNEITVTKYFPPDETEESSPGDTLILKHMKELKDQQASLSKAKKAGESGNPAEKIESDSQSVAEVKNTISNPGET